MFIVQMDHKGILYHTVNSSSPWCQGNDFQLMIGLTNQQNSQLFFICGTNLGIFMSKQVKWMSKIYLHIWDFNPLLDTSARGHWYICHYNFCQSVIST